MRPAGYHAANILIHALTGFFLFLLCRRILLRPATMRPERAAPDLVAVLAALLWLAHPLHTQSVTYIVQRMNGLAALFYVLALYLYARGRAREEQGGNGKQWPWLAGALAVWLMALGSKEIAITWPLAVFLYEWYFIRDLRTDWLRTRYVKVTATLLVIVTGLISLLAGGKLLTFLQAGYAERSFTLTERLLTQPRVVLFYLSQLIYPHPGRLSLVHDFPLSKSFLDPASTLLAILALLAIAAAAVVTARRFRLLSFAILWLLLHLVLESSVLGLEMVFEHRTYLPSMFFFLWLADLGWRRLPRKSAVPAVSIALLAMLSVWTWQRNSVWREPLLFWTDAVTKAPGNPRAHNNLGSALQSEGQLAAAGDHYQQALHLDPAFAVAHANFGSVLQEQGRLPEAIDHYRQALRIKPESLVARYNLGSALQLLGNDNEAISHYLLTLEARPDHADAHHNLAFALQKQGRAQEAIDHYQQAIRFAPDHLLAHYNLGRLFEQLGRRDEAARLYQKALRIEPRFEKARQRLAGLPPSPTH